MFDAESFFNSLKISWVKRFCIDLIDDHWCDLLDRELNTNKLERSNICQWGIDKFEAIIKQNLPCISSFFKQWVKFKTVFHNRDPTTHNHLLNSPLFYNPLFKSRSNNKKLKSLKPKDFGMTECTITFGDLLGDQGICSFDKMKKVMSCVYYSLYSTNLSTTSQCPLGTSSVHGSMALQPQLKRRERGRQRE